MSKENILMILWVIFGFTFVAAIDSILYFFIHLVYFGASGLGLSFALLRYSIPIITVIFYIITAVLLLKNLKTKSNSEGVYLTDFPKKAFIIFVIIALLLKPIANKLSGLHAEYYVSSQNIHANDYLDFYGWMHATLAISRWGAIIILAFIYLKKYQSLKIKTE